MKYDLDYIEKIAKIVTDNALTEVTLSQGEEIITIRKENNIIASAPAVIAQTPVQPEPIEEEKPLKEEIKPPVQRKTITSPMVGAFYASPSPGAKPFVKVGDMVSTGQVVCIVEAMKLMNEIESEVSGKVTQICVEDGQSVEYGQVLMYIE